MKLGMTIKTVEYKSCPHQKGCKYFNEYFAMMTVSPGVIEILPGNHPDDVIFRCHALRECNKEYSVSFFDEDSKQKIECEYLYFLVS